MIPSHIIDEIRERADILSIVGEYVKLRKTGKNFIGLCPFHSEKTASFTVSPEKKLFHCFGCGEGGNIFAFIMKTENASFAEAAKILGEKTGIDVPDASGRIEGKWSALEEVVRLASEHFQNTLRDEHAGKMARNYIADRGLADEVVKAFKLGWAEDSWESLIRYLVQKGVHPNDIEKAGLAVPKEGGGFYDRFRGRLMFPVENHRGLTVGFGGRTLGDIQPKYINSPETPIYNKGYILYGMDLSKDFIRKESTAVVVEGYMDAISCFQAGIKNVVASMGTALTDNQVKLLGRFSSNIILAYDTDLAGETATKRGVDLLKAAGLAVKVAKVSSGKDPDQLIREKGPAAFKKVVDEATPWLMYSINAVLERSDLKEIESKAKAIRSIAGIISTEPDRLVRAEYINYAASRLGTNAENIAAEVKRESYYSGGKRGTEQKRMIEKPVPKILKAESNILRLAIENGEARKALKENLHWGEFSDGSLREIAELMSNIDIGEEKELVPFMLENLPTEESKKKLSALLVSEHAQVDPGKQAEDYINTIKAHRLSARIADIRKQMEEAEKKSEFERVKLLQKEFADSSRVLRELERK